MRAVTQSCLTVSDPTDCGILGSSAHGISQAQMVFLRQGLGCHFLLQGIFLTQGSNLHLLGLLYRQDGSLPPAPPGKPMESWAGLIIINNYLHTNSSLGGKVSETSRVLGWLPKPPNPKLTPTHINKSDAHWWPQLNPTPQACILQLLWTRNDN